MIKEATPKLNKSAGLRHQEQEDIVSIFYDSFSLICKKASSYSKAN